MAENYGYERHDAGEHHEAGYDEVADDTSDGFRYYEEYLDAVGDDGYEYDDDTDLGSDEPVGDERHLREAVNEPVDDAVDDPAVNDSLAYERIRRMKSSRWGRAQERRESNWTPPDLRWYGSPVFGPAEDPHGVGGPHGP